MTTLDAALARLAELDEAALGHPWTWRDGRMDVRHAFYRTLEDAQEALVPVSAAAHPESRRILALAQRAFGDLRGLVDRASRQDLLDRAPREGEWPLRQVLRHMLGHRAPVRDADGATPSSAPTPTRCASPRTA